MGEIDEKTINLERNWVRSTTKHKLDILNIPTNKYLVVKSITNKEHLRIDRQRKKVEESRKIKDFTKFKLISVSK